MKELSNNLLAAYLDGNVDADEAMAVIDAVSNDAELQEFMELSAAIDADMEQGCVDTLPMAAKAAKTEDSSCRCAMMCELHILRKNGLERSERDWETQARNQGWLKYDGMALFNIGRMLEQECFSIRRTFHNTLNDIREALGKGEHVIAVVDRSELTSNQREIEMCRLADEVIGRMPNHAVVVESYNEKRKQITYYDPGVKDGRTMTLSAQQFEDAWDDSSCYLVRVSKRDFSDYVPHPIDLSDVELPDDISDLREAIAENAHEVWAEGRKKQGWTYGRERNDERKETPDMVPYSDLTDQEKVFDREMAMNTIKLLRKLGYRLVKE